MRTHRSALSSSALRTALLLLAAPQALSACSSDSAASSGLDPGDTSGPYLDAAERLVDAGSDSPSDLLDAAMGNPLEAADAGSAAADATTAARFRVSLVLPERWMRVGPEGDPFEDRPSLVNCASGATMTETLSEERVYSVDTGACEYLTATQNTRREILRDEIVKVRLWHFELNAGESAEAHAAVTIDGLSVFDERVPIPQPGGLISRQTRAPHAIPAGAPVLFHLHNHGANSWSLVEVSAGP